MDTQVMETIEKALTEEECEVLAFSNWIGFRSNMD